VAFQTAGVIFEPPREAGFRDSLVGRLVLTMTRIICNTNDYVAFRVLLGLRPGVGIGTCRTITDTVIGNNLNYKSLFYQPLPNGVFSGRALAALNHARALCEQLQGWQSTETIAQHLPDISAIIDSVFPNNTAHDWQTFASSLPSDMTLEELRDYLWADSDEQQETLLKSVLSRLDIPVPAAGLLPPRVRVMTMHGAKGLSSKIVFIPGLEEQMLPGPWRTPYPGLVLEAARLLYVAITRARAACIISFAQTRNINGQFGRQIPSRFAANLGGNFVARTSGLTGVEIASISAEVSNL
jgi:DNA helicase-2/ATP-dependent DNA helicase PcrA